MLGKVWRRRASRERCIGMLQRRFRNLAWVALLQILVQAAIDELNGRLIVVCIGGITLWCGALGSAIRTNKSYTSFGLPIGTCSETRFW